MRKQLNILRKHQSGKFTLRGGSNKPHSLSGLASGSSRGTSNQRLWVIQRSFPHCLFSLIPFVHRFFPILKIGLSLKFHVVQDSF